MKLNCLQFKFLPKFKHLFPEDKPNHCLVCRSLVGPGNVILPFFGVINVLNVDKENMRLVGVVQTNDNLRQSRRAVAHLDSNLQIFFLARAKKAAGRAFC